MAISFFKREPEIELPPLPATATVARPNGNMELPDVDKQRLETIERAGIYAGEFRKELRELQIQLTENTLKLESARRENGELRVSVAQSFNDRTALQSQIENQRQEISDLRAILSSIRLQLDHGRIPLPPVWELLRQTQAPKEVSNVLPVEPVDRPENGTDKAAG